MSDARGRIATTSLRRAATWFALTSLLIAACGLGDKQARADAIVDGVGALDELAMAEGRVSVELRIVRLPTTSGFDAGGTAGAGNEDAPTAGVFSDASTATFGIGLDMETRTAVLTHDGDSHQIFVDGETYGRRNDAIDGDARPWMRLTFDEVDEDESHVDARENPASAILSSLNPVLLVDLAAGPLAGSAEAPAGADLGNEPMSRYRVNMDIQKTLEDTRRDHYDEDAREDTLVLLDLLDVSGTIHPADVWLDDTGMLRRFVWHLELEPFRDVVLEATIDLRLRPGTEPLELVVPTDAELLEVDSLLAFVRSIVPRDGAATGDGGVVEVDSEQGS